MKERKPKELFLTIIVTISSIIITFSLTFVFSRTSWFSVLVLVLSVITAFSAILFLAFYTYMSKVNESIQDTIKGVIFKGRYQAMALSGCGGVPQIFPAKDVAEMEVREKFDEIWLVTHDLKTEVNNGDYATSVVKNLEKGVRYVYFIPNNEINLVRANQLKFAANNNPNLVFYPLDEKFFFLAPNFDFSIYNPDCGSTRQSFMGLQLPNIDERYEAKIDDALTDSIAETLGKIKEKGETL